MNDQPPDSPLSEVVSSTGSANADVPGYDLTLPEEEDSINGPEWKGDKGLSTNIIARLSSYMTDYDPIRGDLSENYGIGDKTAPFFRALRSVQEEAAYSKAIRSLTNEQIANLPSGLDTWISDRMTEFAATPRIIVWPGGNPDMYRDLDAVFERGDDMWQDENPGEDSEEDAELYKLFYKAYASGELLFAFEELRYSKPKNIGDNDSENNGSEANDREVVLKGKHALLQNFAKEHSQRLTDYLDTKYKSPDSHDNLDAVTSPQ